MTKELPKPALLTEIFRFLTPASAHCVWTELTRTGEPLPHLYGLTVHTDWKPQSVITAGLPAGPSLTGEVLHTEPPRRLTYSLGDQPGAPSVYITWQLEPVAAGTLVRLYVDEPGPSASLDLELAWLPLLDTLQARLAACQPGPSAR